MKHIRYEEWVAYVEDTLEEETRMTYESHLYMCDQCLGVYAEAVEACAKEKEAPEYTIDTSQLIQQTKTLPGKSLKNKEKEQLQRKTVIHYLIAAGFTIFFMSSGIFTQFIHVVSEFERQGPKKNESFVQTLLEKQEPILQHIENIQERGEK